MPIVPGAAISFGARKRGHGNIEVLPGHRPRSIALCSAGCQRHGTQQKSGSYRLALPPLKVPVPT
jgi:hypothetical protein